jgi:hypothetical protein
MRKIALPLAVFAAALLAGGATIATAAKGDKVFNVKLDGKQETPKGSTTGKGTAKITLNASTGKVCFALTWSKIDTPNAAHIHKGAKGKAGPVVIPLFATPPKHKGCVTAKKSLVSAIAKSPSGYYVNVHTAKFPGGALRAQL